MLREITLGQYYPVDSFIHRLDPRVKLAGTFLFLIALFIVNSWTAYAVLALVLFGFILLSKVPFSFMVRGLKSVLFLLLLSVSFNLFLTPGEELFRIFFLKMTKEGLQIASMMAIRLVMLVLSSSILTLTTTPNALTDGMEKGLGIFKLFHFPVHEIAMMMSIALRFIPILVEEFLRVDCDFDINNRDFIDVMNIFMKMEPRTLKGAYRFFCHAELQGAHGATADTKATYDVLKAMLGHYEGTQYEDAKGEKSQGPVNDMKQLAAFSAHHRNADLSGQIVFDEAGKEVFQFGKHKGKRVEDVFCKEPAYYAWIMNSDFPLYTKKVVTAIKLRMGGKTARF